MEQRLSQILAVEKQVKNKANDVGASVLKSLQKPDLFNGHRREFHPLNEDCEALPPDNKPLTESVKSLITKAFAAQAELIDCTLTKDMGNREVMGQLELGGKTLSLPVPFLLWMEKQLLDLRTMFEAVPVLDPAKRWIWDDVSGCYTTQESQVSRYKKKSVPLVLYPATDKHPAQVKEIQEEVLQGHWHVSYVSSAVPAEQKARWIERAEDLLKKVKKAREGANATKVTEASLARDLARELGLE